MSGIYQKREWMILAAILSDALDGAAGPQQMGCR
jgi:hypothetical protein